MGKKKNKQRVLHISKEYRGYLDEMPAEIKSKIEAK